MLKQLFSILPEDPDDESTYEHPWWNDRYEYHGPRVHFVAGDLSAEAEHEYGSYAGAQFEASLHLFCEDIPEFHVEGHPNAEYDIHMLTLIFWRWGIYVSIRGRLR